MGYLNNSTTVLDAILTKKGRELLSRGVNEFAVTKFALADDEVDYALWDVSHPLGTDYYGTVIENTPLLEPTPNANTTMKYKLVTRPSGTTNMSTIINVNSSYEVIYDAALGQPVGSQTVTPSSTNLPNGNVDPNGYSFTLLNSSIPIEIKRNYTTVYDNQESVLVDVYQGERSFSKDNIYLGDFILDDLEKNSTKKPDIEITFRITIDGNLHVSAQDLKTKSKRSIEIKNSLKIPKDKVAKLKKYADEMLETDTKKIQKLEKIINLSLLKKVFEKIDQPILSTSDELTVEEMNSILINKEVSNEELDEISRLMRIIIREQDAFKIEDEESNTEETQGDDHDVQDDDVII